MYKANKKSVTITFDNIYTEAEIKALCVLLGGYNQYGRKMELEKYTQAQEKFYDIIDEVTNNI